MFLGWKSFYFVLGELREFDFENNLIKYRNGFDVLYNLHKTNERVLKDNSLYPKYTNNLTKEVLTKKFSK